MSGVIAPPIPARQRIVGGLDCSEPTQRWRRDMLKGLLTKKYSGVQSLGDRGRSVTYLSPKDLQQQINDLKGEIALCDNTPLPQRPKLFTVPYDKWD